MIGTLFTVGKFGWAWFHGTDAIVEAVVQYGVKLALRSKKTDSDTGDEMVQQMRADAPVLSGRLVNGISVRVDDSGDDGEVTVVEATAIHGDYDYAAFVDRGTKNMEAEPFFYVDAEAVLEARGTSLEQAMDDVGKESGF